MGQSLHVGFSWSEKNPSLIVVITASMLSISSSKIALSARAMAKRSPNHLIFASDDAFVLSLKFGYFLVCSKK